MSTITRKWDETFIRSIISELDKKTGLDGSELPIELGHKGQLVGGFGVSLDGLYFFFSEKYFNDPELDERGAIDIIRHEYAHFYVFVTGISRFFRQKRNAPYHGDAWKWACKMVGATPNRCYSNDRFVNVPCDENEVLSLYLAEDVPELHIIDYIRKWNRLPDVDGENYE